MNEAERERLRLQELHDTLPPKLPDVPKWLLDLSRNQRKLQEIRGKKVNEKEMSELQKKYQGIVLQNFKKSLIEVDTLHKKAVVELKSIDGKLNKLKAISDSKK